MFSPDEFRAQGHAIVDLLANWMSQSQARAVEPVMPRETPSEMCREFPPSFEGGAALMPLLERVLEGSTALHSPRFVGHQVATPVPLAALCDFVASVTNNGMAVYEMGPAATAMERAVLSFFARAIGFSDASGGVLTSGGSLGNLTALLAARQRCDDVWHRGLASAPQMVMVCAEGAHYSNARAGRILGLGDRGIITVSVDEQLRMRPEALEHVLRALEAQGRRVMAVVASAGATTAGSFDPLEEIARICNAHTTWLHVDGAHGASLALSPLRKHLVAGIEQADSVVWDAHKMLGMPALVTAVLFKNAVDGTNAFAQQAHYLFEEDDSEQAWSDVGKRTIECTKRMMSLKVYTCLSVFGAGAFAAHVDRLCDLGASFSAMLAERGLQTLVSPQANIVVFRRAGDNGGVSAAIRKRLLEEGRFYLVQVRIGAELWLRCALMNPLTTKEDLGALIDAVLEGP